MFFRSEELHSFSIWGREFETADGFQKAFKIPVGPRGKQFSVRMEGGAMAAPSVSIANKALPHAVCPEPGGALDAVAASMEHARDEPAARAGGGGRWRARAGDRRGRSYETP